MGVTINSIDVLKERKENKKQDFVDLYNEATEDYEFWSKDFNMHFGYFIPFKTEILRRDSMLNEMNRQIFNRLKPQSNTVLVDMGCGMGGTMRYGLKNISKLSIKGVTLSDFQVREGNLRLQDYERGTILKEDYNHTTFDSAEADGVYALESLCHSGHHIDSFREAYRILKPKGKFVIADAFLKKEEKSLNKISKYTYTQLCKGWDLKGLGSLQKVKENLEQVGFKNIEIEDASFRVAPSVLHVPFAILGFVVKKLLKREKLKPQSLNNLKGSLFALLSGLQMTTFGYYIITAEK